MAHFISGLIGRSDTLDKLSQPFASRAAAELDQGYAFLPLDEPDFRRIAGGTPGVAVDDDDESFQHLTWELIEILQRASSGCEFAYVETEYFGGVGGQGAIAFRNGATIYGPLYAQGGTINQALALIGVVVDRGKLDEFDALGLTSFRSNDRLPARRPRGTA